MGRYIAACGGKSKQAMTLYRLNLRLSQEMFTVIICVEVALRNSINRHYTNIIGYDWLLNASETGGIFDNTACRETKRSIREEVRILGNRYTHDKLVAGLGFGFWRYLFAAHQYQYGGNSLLSIFPAKPRSTPQVQYNQRFVFNQLASLNSMRNRIAHHEPICFRPSSTIKDTTYTRQHYGAILQMFHWMGIDEASLLYGLDHINRICDEIDAL